MFNDLFVMVSVLINVLLPINALFVFILGIMDKV